MKELYIWTDEEYEEKIRVVEERYLNGKKCYKVQVYGGNGWEDEEEFDKEGEAIEYGDDLANRMCL